MATININDQGLALCINVLPGGTLNSCLVFKGKQYHDIVDMPTPALKLLEAVLEATLQGVSDVLEVAEATDKITREALQQ